MTPAPPPLHFGPYEVIGELGRGGLGVVYLAVRSDDQYRKHVAVKVMQAGAGAEEILRRFRHERQILANLQHPNIAQLLDGGTTDQGLPYFVMEYIEGRSLLDYCTEMQLEVDDRLRLFRSVCSAVQYVHQHLVVHRDLKPGNILVGADGVPKLLDFGIAKILGPGLGVARDDMTRPDVRPLTPGYASPEQVRGEPITTASDIYSLGIVLYELLTGHRPYEFPDDSPLEIARVVSETQPGPPSATVSGAVGRELRGDLDNIVMTAIRKEPDRRYASAEQFSEDLRRYLEGLPVQAHHDTWGYRSGKFVRRHAGGVLAVSLLVLSLVAGMAATLRQTRIAQTERARAERRFNEVRRIAHSFLFEFHPLIENLEGSTPARKLLVQRALEYLRGLSQEAAGDASLSSELAEAFLLVGDVQGNPYVANLGDTAGARSSYEQAVEIGERLLKAEPSKKEWKRLAARAHRSLGEILPLLGKAPDAMPHLRQAVALLEAVSAGAPTDISARIDLASAYEMLGDVSGRSGIVSLGDADAARDAFQKALAIDRVIVQEQPSNTRARRGCAVLRMKIGDLSADIGDNTAALESYQQASAIAVSLSSADPANVAARRLTAMIHRKLGAAYRAGKHNEQALEELRQSSATIRAMVEADPANAQARLDYTLAAVNIAEVLAEMGQNDAALSSYREAAEGLAKLSEAEPGNSMLRGRYAMVLEDIGSVLYSVHRQREALAAYSQGLTLARPLAMRAEATPDEIGRFAESLLDCPIASLRNPAEALSMAERSVSLTQRKIAKHLELLARACFEAGDAARAVSVQQEALKLLEGSPAHRAAEEKLARYQSPNKGK